MAVAFDAETMGSTFTTTSPNTFVHTPVGTPRGVVVSITLSVSSDSVSAVTYGGVAMAQILNVDSGGGEAGRAQVWFLGASIPTGAQTVSIAHNGGSFNKAGSCVTVTASADTEIGDDNSQAGAVDDPSIALVTTPTSLRVGALHTGLNALTDFTETAGFTNIGGYSNSFRSAKHSRETTPSSGSTSYGFTTSVASDLALVGVAVQEVAAATQNLTGTLFTKAPTFFTGAVGLVSGDQTLTGTLFQKSPSFFGGSITGGTVTAAPSTTPGSIRVEVWSLPDDPDGFRLLCEPPFLNGTSFQDRADVYGGGQLIVPADYEHLGLIVQVDPSDIESSHSSIVVGLQYWGVDDGWVVVWEFFADEAEEEITKEGQRVVVISGLDVRAAPDDGIVYPRQPTAPHWEWGAPTMLENAGFEDSGFTNLIIHLWLEEDVSAGTFNIEFDDGAIADDVTLNWDTDLPAVQTGIEGLSNITDILIAGAGTETNPWVIEVINPGGTGFNVTVDSSGLTDGVALMLLMVPGGFGVVEPWTRSFNPATGLFHGTYTNFQISTTQAHTGTSSLYVKGSLGDWPGSWPGAQQIVSVGEGEHWAAIWVYPLFDARYRFVLRTIDETLIDFVEADLTANSWQELRINPVVFPLYVAQIIFRISCISNTPNVHEFYVDDGMLAPGFPATTWGDILSILMGQAFARGTLDWLDLGFDAALDSDGIVWDTDEFAFQADALMKLGSHVVADGEAAGYEHDVVRIDPPGAQTHILHAYNPAGRGETSGQAAVVGSFNAARVAKRRIPYTHLLLELNDGSHVEVADARLSGFGRRERGVRVEQATDVFTAEKIGQAIFDKEIVNLLATQVTLSGDSVLPYRDFDIGWIVPHTLARRALKHDRRIQVITSAFSQSRWVYVVTAGGVEDGS